jgi:hypothetical protein
MHAPSRPPHPTRRRPSAAGPVLLLVLLLASGAAGVPARAAALLDRIVATVDDDPILASELEPPIALGLIAPQDGESPEALRRRVLDDLIDERLRYHEVSRFGGSSLPVEAIDEQVAAIRARFADPEELATRLAAAGMNEEGLRQLVARQILVLTYVEERLGPRVFVTLDEIRSYYQSSFEPQLVAAGQPVPALDEVREQIRQLLKAERLNQEVERWTEELRRAADVVDRFDEVVGPPAAATSP